VHRATDGFRELPEGPLATGEPLPDAWWTASSGLHCLDRVVSDVWREGYSHHITRLMVLSNLALLLDVDPRALTDWFWVAYTDAYDWVVEPNVLGMGTFAAGDLMTTKPYVSGSAYLDRMGDYCRDCAFDPKGNCPVTPMYWAFLQRHRSRLEGNRRMSLPLASAAKRKEALQERDRAVFGIVSRRLQAGLPVGPGDLPPP
jgi:deoxyribodipyrimidine photolyase-related protein